MNHSLKPYLLFDQIVKCIASFNLNFFTTRSQFVQDDRDNISLQYLIPFEDVDSVYENITLL